MLFKVYVNTKTFYLNPKITLLEELLIIILSTVLLYYNIREYHQIT